MHLSKNKTHQIVFCIFTCFWYNQLKLNFTGIEHSNMVYYKIIGSFTVLLLHKAGKIIETRSVYK